MLSGTTVLGWCLSTDTDPWQALAHRWPLTAAATLAAMLAAAVAVPVLRGHRGAPLLRTWLRGLVPTLAAVAVVVILPALIVWDAATSAGTTDAAAGKVGTVVVAATAAVAVSVAFWYGAGAPVSLTAMTAAGVAAALALLSGSVLAAAVPSALLLSRTPKKRSRPNTGGGDARPQTITALRHIRCAVVRRSGRQRWRLGASGIGGT